MGSEDHHKGVDCEFLSGKSESFPYRDPPEKSVRDYKGIKRPNVL